MLHPQQGATIIADPLPALRKFTSDRKVFNGGIVLDEIEYNEFSGFSLTWEEVEQRYNRNFSLSEIVSDPLIKFLIPNDETRSEFFTSEFNVHRDILSTDDYAEIWFPSRPKYPTLRLLQVESYAQNFTLSANAVAHSANRLLISPKKTSRSYPYR